MRSIRCVHCGYVFIPSIEQLMRGKTEVNRSYVWVHLSCPACHGSVKSAKIKRREYAEILKPTHQFHS